MSILNGRHALEQAMIQLKADASSKPHFIQTLLSSDVYFEGRQEGDSFRIYEQNLSDGSHIIDLYTSKRLLLQAEGVNPEYCQCFNAGMLLTMVKDKSCLISLNHATPDEMIFTPCEVQVMLGIIPQSDDELLGEQVVVRPVQTFSKEWALPLAAVCQRFKSAQAAYLGVVDDGGRADALSCALLVIDTTPSDDLAQMKDDVLDVAMELSKTLKIDMGVAFNESSSSDDDIAKLLVQQTQPFYVKSKSNQWRKRLGLPPAISVQTV